MKTLSNSELTIRVAPHGAELCSICFRGREYLWQADPAYWKRHSPVLFPIVGSLWNATYRMDGQVHQLSQHGFARDRDFSLVSESANELRFVLESDEATCALFPADFRLEIGYRLVWRKIQVIWKVTNTGSAPLHFQIGAHPAFYYSDHAHPEAVHGYFLFDRSDLSYRVLAEKGCVGDEVRPMPIGKNGFLPLDAHTFDIDTFILENSQVKRIHLLDHQARPYLTVNTNAPLVGLWSPPHKDAPFVCVEPWYGRCDRVNYEGEFKDRDWVNHLEPGHAFNAFYEIVIHPYHI